LAILTIFDHFDHFSPFLSIGTILDHLEPFWIILDHFGHFYHFGHFFNFYSEFFSGCFDTSGSMVPRLVPEISSLDAFCDGAAAEAVAGIGDSRSWMGRCNDLKTPPYPELETINGKCSKSHNYE